MVNREMAALAWHQHAACREPGLAKLFFGPSDKGDVARSQKEKRRIEQAVRVCRDCPVQQDCLEHALRYPESWGIWGGMTQQARARLRNKLRSRKKRRLAVSD